MGDAYIDITAVDDSDLKMAGAARRQMSHIANHDSNMMMCSLPWRAGEEALRPR